MRTSHSFSQIQAWVPPTYRVRQDLPVVYCVSDHRGKLQQPWAMLRLQLVLLSIGYMAQGGPQRSLIKCWLHPALTFFHRQTKGHWEVQGKPTHFVEPIEIPNLRDILKKQYQEQWTRTFLKRNILNKQLSRASQVLGRARNKQNPNDCMKTNKNQTGNKT